MDSSLPALSACAASQGPLRLLWPIAPESGVSSAARAFRQGLSAGVRVSVSLVPCAQFNVIQKRLAKPDFLNHNKYIATHNGLENGMQVNFIKTRSAQPMGQYKPTGVDAAKAAAEFRLIAVGSKNTIVWADGRSDYVTDAKLSKLQAAHTWAADF